MMYRVALVLGLLTLGTNAEAEFVTFAQWVERWSQFLRQRAKVDSPMRRMNHHEDSETVFG